MRLPRNIGIGAGVTVVGWLGPVSCSLLWRQLDRTAFPGTFVFWYLVWGSVPSRSGCAAVSCGALVMLSPCDVTVSSVVCGWWAVFEVLGSVRWRSDGLVSVLMLRHKMSGSSFLSFLRRVWWRSSFSTLRISAVSDVAALWLSDVSSGLSLPVSCREWFHSLSGLVVLDGGDRFFLGRRPASQNLSERSLWCFERAPPRLCCPLLVWNGRDSL